MVKQTADAFDFCVVQVMLFDQKINKALIDCTPEKRADDDQVFPVRIGKSENIIDIIPVTVQIKNIVFCSGQDIPEIPVQLFRRFQAPPQSDINGRKIFKRRNQIIKIQ